MQSQTHLQLCFVPPSGAADIPGLSVAPASVARAWAIQSVMLFVKGDELLSSHNDTADLLVACETIESVLTKGAQPGHLTGLLQGLVALGHQLVCKQGCMPICTC